MRTLPANDVYNERAPERFPMNLTTAARGLGISIQRLSRYLKHLQVPVIRDGYSLKIKADGYAKVKRSLSRNELKRGRKKKAS